MVNGYGSYFKILGRANGLVVLSTWTLSFLQSQETSNRPLWKLLWRNQGAHNFDPKCLTFGWPKMSLTSLEMIHSQPLIFLREFGCFRSEKLQKSCMKQKKNIRPPLFISDLFADTSYTSCLAGASRKKLTQCFTRCRSNKSVCPAPHFDPRNNLLVFHWIRHNLCCIHLGPCSCRVMWDALPILKDLGTRNLGVTNTKCRLIFDSCEWEVYNYIIVLQLS